MISVVELHSDLFDTLIWAATQNLSCCLQGCLGVLPAEVAAGLRSYVRAHPEPRLFHPLPHSQTERAEAGRRALEARADILLLLDQACGDGPA